MLIECLIERDGPTVMHINGFKHTFVKNERGHYVANVCSREHQEWLLETGNFRPYEPDAVADEKPQDKSNPEQEHGDDGAHAKTEMGEVVLASNGQPFTNRNAAQVKAKRLMKKTGKKHAVVPLEGGFGVVLNKE